jgi:predicted nucleic acid-binding protein
LIDTNIFLNVLRSEEPYSSSSGALLADVEEKRVNGLASTVTLAEILVGAYKAGDEATKIVDLALRRLEGRGFLFVAVDEAVARRGAEVRAKHGLGLPDALIAATGLLTNVDRLVSRDKKAYAKVDGLRPATPEELGYR